MSAIVDTVATERGGLGSLRAWTLAFLCTSSVWLSLPTIHHPFGTTEEGVNAAIWALGGRNILLQGPLEAKLGARVAPYRGTGGGIYAHHPPLPVWISAALQLVGPWEALPRLAAHGALALALLLLFRILKLSFDDTAALVGVAAAAGSGFALTYARLFTTLTLAAPLVLYLLWRALLRRRHGTPYGFGFYLAIVLAVFSSWDGVIGCAAVLAYVTWSEWAAARAGRLGWRAYAKGTVPGWVGLASVLVLAGYLIWANGGPAELIGQFFYRSGAGGVPYSFKHWVRVQLGYWRAGLGPLSLGLLALAPVWWWLTRRRQGWISAMALAAAPAVGMTALFSEGAVHHAFWSYNLIWPLAFVVAAAWTVLRRAPRWASMASLSLLVGQSAYLGWRARRHLRAEAALNQTGQLVQDHFADTSLSAVPLFSGWEFHPHVNWYVDREIDVAIMPQDLLARVRSGAWAPSALVLADTVHARANGCLFEELPAARSARWIVATAGELQHACEQLPAEP